MFVFKQVTRLCDLSVDGDSVTSVCWNERVSKRLLLVCGTREESTDRRTNNVWVAHVLGEPGRRRDAQRLRSGVGCSRREEADQFGGPLSQSRSVRAGAK